MAQLRPTLISICLLGALSCSEAPRTGKTLEEALRTARPDDFIPVLVYLSEPEASGSQVLSALRAADRHQRRAALVEALRARTESSQRAARGFLERSGVTEVRSLWIINALAARVHPSVARALPGVPGVQRLALDQALQAPSVSSGSPSTPEWNIAAVHAPALWALGFDGTDVVVANMDSGVDILHPDLQSRWRGGTDSWWDPFRNTATPYDVSGHGTGTMGVLVGGSAGGSAIGVAPGARWIAAKIYDDMGQSRESVIHEAFQWLLSPSGIPGAPDAPDVVNASWGTDSVGSCDETFEPDLQALRAAGIVVVFGAGNSGPNPATSIGPANNPDGYAVGSVDQNGAVDSESSRGPSACPGTGVFPDLVAPGVNVKTAAMSLGGIPQYNVLSGTSLAAPHVAGVMALLAAAFPAATPDTLEETLRNTARDLGQPGPDDDSGHGLVDAEAAYRVIGAATPLSFVTSALPAAQQGIPYAETVKAVGSIAPYSWSVVGGSLPAGLSLSATSGTIGGTPTALGDSTFTFSVQGTVGAAVTRTFSLSVVQPSLAVLTTSLPDATLGAAYSQTLSAAGGTPPYRWSFLLIGCGAVFPPGLQLDPATGTIAGTPSARGTYSFQARVTDAAAAVASRTLSLTVQ
jgi:hypothetical protein